VHHPPRRTPCAAANRARPGPRRTCRWGINARQHGCCGPLGASTPPTVQSALSTGTDTERQQAARAASLLDALTGETRATLTGERSISGPRFPIGLRGATMAYVASTSTDAAVRRARLARHAPAARNPSASTGHKSSHGPASELPPATSHGYAKWDFSGVPDPVMFRWFLDAANY
jgi:hypothetical protein